MSCRMDERILSPPRKGKLTPVAGSQARRKAKNVGWFVAVAVVAPQTFDHAERVGCPFEQLRELLVVEVEAGTLRRLCAGLARSGVSLASSASQYWRWRHGRRLCAYAELWMLEIPATRLLVGMANAEYRRFVKRSAKDLHAERQGVGGEAGADLQYWLSGGL